MSTTTAVGVTTPGRAPRTGSRLCGAAFLVGGVLIEAGAALRWFAPGFDINARLGDRMSPVFPLASSAAAPGSIEVTTLGYVVLAIAWILLVRVGTSRITRIVLGLAAIPAVAFTGAVTWAGTYFLMAGGHADVSLMEVPWLTIPSIAHVYGLSWLLTVAALVTDGARFRAGLAGALLLTVGVVEAYTLHIVAMVAGVERFVGWDDPFGMWLLSGLGYVVFGGLLIIQRPHAPRPTA